jgi:hypothetical protein
LNHYFTSSTIGWQPATSPVVRIKYERRVHKPEYTADIQQENDTGSPVIDIRSSTLLEDSWMSVTNIKGKKPMQGIKEACHIHTFNTNR